MLTLHLVVAILKETLGNELSVLFADNYTKLCVNMSEVMDCVSNRDLRDFWGTFEHLIKIIRN